MGSRRALRVFLAATIGLASSISTFAGVHAQDALGTIADHDSIFIDGKTFKLTSGKGKADAPARSKALGARDLGPGAIIFRSGEKLYIVDAPLFLPNGPDGRQGAYLDADRERPDRIRIAYDPPKTPDHQTLFDMIKERRVLETLQQILSPFRLPAELTIKTMGCDGMVNSWYNTDNSIPTLHICYELLQDILQTAPKEITKAGITPQDAVVGQFLFWTLHEFGHAIFEMYQVPLFGREEDAADQFAGYVMLQLGEDKARRLIGGASLTAAEFLKNYKQNPVVEKRLEKYSSVHGLPEQRFYNFVCLAYGASSKMFADVVENGFLPKRRADNCEYEYQTFDRAWRSEISPHVDQQLARTVLNSAWLRQPSPQPPRR
jgi:hypothetical protein